MKKLLGTIMALCMFLLCVASNVSAASFNSIENHSEFVNTGIMGEAVFADNTENTITNAGGISTNVVKNQGEYVNTGVIGSFVNAGSTRNILTNVGGDAANIISNIKQVINLGGYMGNYIDASSVYNDVVNMG